MGKKKLNLNPTSRSIVVTIYIYLSKVYESWSNRWHSSSTDIFLKHEHHFLPFCSVFPHYFFFFFFRFSSFIPTTFPLVCLMSSKSHPTFIPTHGKPATQWEDGAKSSTFSLGILWLTYRYTQLIKSFVLHSPS